jgi:putative transcriptional regulator
MTSLRNHLLVASPSMLDPNFEQAVLLMVQHDEQGAMGLILNRPLEATVELVWKEISSAPCPCEAPLYRGGPVAGLVSALHGEPDLAQLDISPGLHFTAAEEHIRALMERDASPLRLFVGYAGWAAGQLEGELAEDAWLSIPARPDDVFSTPEDVWARMVKIIPRAQAFPGVPRDLIPTDPDVN